MNLTEADRLLKSLGLNRHKATYQPAVVMLATSVGMSDSSDLTNKKAILEEAIKVLKDDLNIKIHDVDPMAAILLASEISRQKADKADAEQQAAIEADMEIIRNSLPEYEARVRAGAHPGDTAIRFEAAMVELLGKPLPGLLESISRKLAAIPQEPQDAGLVPAQEEPQAAPGKKPRLKAVDNTPAPE